MGILGLRIFYWVEQIQTQGKNDRDIYIPANFAATESQDKLCRFKYRRQIVPWQSLLKNNAI